MKYKCNNCDDITDFLTLGDTTIGCANCGVRAGFEELDDALHEKEVPTHKEFQKAVDKAGLRGYEFKDDAVEKEGEQ